MLPESTEKELQNRIDTSEHPRELMIDVMTVLQEAYGYLSDAALEKGADMLHMDPVELEQLATFYNFLYREPVGKYVIHVCDSVICFLDGFPTIRDFLREKLGIEMGQTTQDGLFTLLPTCCLGYCDRSPAVLINRKVYGPLTVEQLNDIIEELRAKG